MRFWRHMTTGALLVAVLAITPATSQADQIAVLGSGNLINVINATMPGAGVQVTDAQLATPGFLSTFNAVLITRGSGEFPGPALSAAAAANVAAFVGSASSIGNVALFSADWADIIGVPGAPSVEDGGGNPDATRAFLNALTWAMADHGYIGEFNGADMALTGNLDGFLPLGFIGGSGGQLNCAYSVLETVSVDQPAHPVMNGVSSAFNVQEFACRSSYSGVNPAFVLAEFGNGDPAVLAISGNVAAIPEPASLLLLGSGIAGLLARQRRK